MNRPLYPLIAASLAAALPAAAGTKVLQAFEGDGFDDWKVEGGAFGHAPAPGRLDGLNGELSGYADDAAACSAHGGDATTGALVSPEFEITEPHIRFLIAGGDYPGKTAAQLLVDGEVVREAVGERDLELRPATWDVSGLLGKKAVFRIVDEERGAWGWIAVDHILLTDYPNHKFPATTRGGRLHTAGLVESPALPGVTIPGDVTLKVVAGKEQQVISPTALAFAENGDLYISETHRFRHGVEDNRDNLFWYLDDLAARTTDDRLALHEKWDHRVPMKRLTEKSEIIRRLSAPGADGVFQESSVFAAGFNDPLDGTGAGVFVFDGTVYFACIPKLWMLRDSTGDGKADVREVIEEGFGVRVSLSGHDMNGFALGPDGRIYGTIGDRGLSLTTKEGVEYRYPNEGAAFRFEPDGSGFEIFHTGLRNPKEIAFDKWGNAITVDNNADQGDAARIVYLVEGADSGWRMEHQTMHTFHRQIGLEERPMNRWMDERIWEMPNDAQPAFVLPPVALLTSGPSGLTVHPGTGFLEEEDGRFLICDYKGGAAVSGIWSFAVETDGGGMKMSDARRFNWGAAATDVEYSWDGRVFVTDFIGGWVSHDDGRVYALDAGEKTWRAKEAAEAAKLIAEGFDQRDSAELAALMRHADARVRLRAQIALTRKSDALDRFTAAAASEADEMERLHGIWGLGILARRGGGVPLPVKEEFSALPDATLRAQAVEKLVALFEHEDVEVRAQALRAVAETEAAGDALPLAPLLVDESPRVRFFAAIAAGKLDAFGLYGPVLAFIERNGGGDDRYLRHAGIFALENLVREPSQLTALSSHDSANVRLAAVVALRRLGSPGVAAFLRDRDPRVADEAIRAVTDLSLDEARGAAVSLLEDLSQREWRPFMLRRLIHNAFRHGTAEAAERVLAVAANDQLPEAIRREAFRLLGEWTEPHPADQLTGEWSPLGERDPATIREPLAKALPKVMSAGGFALTESLRLIARHDLKVEGVDPANLKSLVGRGDLPADARAKALELLVAARPEGLAETLAEFAESPADEIAFVALRGLAALEPQRALPALAKAVASSPARARQAWSVLADVPGEAAVEVFVRNLAALKQARGVSPSAIELMEAAAKRPEPEITEALAELQSTLAADEDPLAQWMPALEGGDATAGAALFASHPAGQCMRCHTAEDGHSAGGDAGPNLAGIAKRHNRRYFIESMVAPSATIAPGFGLVSLTFANGATLGGNLVAETDDHLDLDVSGKLVRVPRGKIASMGEPVSSMPPMADLLSLREMRDLVAWLATLDKGGDVPAVAGEPEFLDPDTLPVPAAPAPAAGEGDEAGADPAAMMKLGQQQYLMCGACHGQNGEGTAAGPPLAGSEWVNGPAENLIRIQLRGLIGPIEVKGQQYDFPGGMQPMAYQNDEQIAAVLTFVRNSFGNEGAAVSPEDVAALRGEVGKPQLTAGELLPPPPAPAAGPETSAAPSAPASAARAAAPAAPSRYDDLSSGSGLPWWAVVGVIGFIGVCLVPVVCRRG